MTAPEAADETLLTDTRWKDYRVVRRDDGTLSVHEALYDDVGDLRSIVRQPVKLIATDMGTLRAALRQVAEGLDRPVVDVADIRIVEK